MFPLEAPLLYGFASLALTGETLFPPLAPFSVGLAADGITAARRQAPLRDVPYGTSTWMRTSLPSSALNSVEALPWETAIARLR